MLNLSPARRRLERYSDGSPARNSCAPLEEIDRFKGPFLRGLAARAPHFHNGFAKHLAAVIDFYD